MVEIWSDTRFGDICIIILSACGFVKNVGTLMYWVVSSIGFTSTAYIGYR